MLSWHLQGCSRSAGSDSAGQCVAHTPLSYGTSRRSREACPAHPALHSTDWTCRWRELEVTQELVLITRFYCVIGPHRWCHHDIHHVQRIAFNFPPRKHCLFNGTPKEMVYIHNQSNSACMPLLKQVLLLWSHAVWQWATKWCTLYFRLTLPIWCQRKHLRLIDFLHVENE